MPSIKLFCPDFAWKQWRNCFRVRYRNGSNFKYYWCNFHNVVVLLTHTSDCIKTMFYSLILIIPLRFGRKKGEMIVVSMSAKLCLYWVSCCLATIDRLHVIDQVNVTQRASVDASQSNGRLSQMFRWKQKFRVVLVALLRRRRGIWRNARLDRATKCGKIDDHDDNSLVVWG